MEELLMGVAVIVVAVCVGVASIIATEDRLSDACLTESKFTVYINSEPREFKCELVKPEKQMVEK